MHDFRDSRLLFYRVSFNFKLFPDTIHTHAASVSENNLKTNGFVISFRSE